MEIFLPTVRAVIRIHAAESRERRTAPGIRDQGLLESAIGRAASHLAYADAPTLASAAASLAYGLAKNHPFVDGNKRVSYLVTNAFLEVHGQSLAQIDEDARVAVWLSLADGSLSEAELCEWIANSCRPIGQSGG
jgi:death-on-curing protein